MFGSKVRELKERIEYLRKDRNSYRKIRYELLDKVEKLQKDIGAISAREKKLIKERDELKKLVREQTDSDLLINALKAVGMIKDEKETDYQAEAMRLYDLRAGLGLANQGQANCGLSPLFGGGVNSWMNRGFL